MTLVLDASVAAKWFTAEAGSAEAEALADGREILIAPELVIVEVCNVIATKQRTGQLSANQAASALQTLPGLFDTLFPCTPLARRALDMAEALAHPAYDCFYMALAEAQACRLVTADSRLIRRVVGTEWATLIMPLTPAA